MARDAATYIQRLRAKMLIGLSADGAGCGADFILTSAPRGLPAIGWCLHLRQFPSASSILAVSCSTKRSGT